jgi:hypothetical protein
MGKPRTKDDIIEYHNRAKKAVEQGLTMKEFARKEKTLSNNVEARLYQAVQQGLSIITFPEPLPGTTRRGKGPDNVTSITLFTGRAKTPYLTLKVPPMIVKKAGKEGDLIEWEFTRGRIIGKKKNADDLL